MAKEKRTLEERYADEVLTDNAALNHYAQCKDCFFRFKDYFEFRGQKIKCHPEDGWKKCVCHMFPEDKPDEVYNNTGECEYYEKQKG